MRRLSVYVLCFVLAALGTAQGQERIQELKFNGYPNVNATEYAGVDGWRSGDPAYTYYVLPQAFTPTALNVACGTAVTAGNVAFALYTNGSASGDVTCTISTGTTCQWSGSASALSAGDRVNIRMVGSSDLTGGNYCNMTVKGSAAGDALVQLGLSGTGLITLNTANSVGKYCGVSSDSGVGSPAFCQEATAANAAMIAASAATLTGFSMRFSGPCGSGNSATLEVCQLGVGDGSCDSTTNGLTGLSVTVDNDNPNTAYDTSCTNNCTLAAGAQYVIKNTAQTGSGCYGSWSFIITLSDVGDHMQMRQTRTNAAAYWSSNMRTGSKANACRRVTTAATAKNLRCMASATPAANSTYKVCVGNTNAPTCSDTLKCTIETSGTTCSETGQTVSVAADDYVCIEKGAEGGTTGTSYCVVELAGVDAPTATPTNTSAPTATPTATPTNTPPPGCCDVGGSVGCHTPKADYRTPDATPCATEATFSEASACVPNS